VLYDIVKKNFVPKAVAESVFQKSKSEVSAQSVVYSASSIIDALLSLEKHIECQGKLNRLEAESMLKKANRYYGLGDYEEAMKCCDEALGIDPSLVKASILKTQAMAKIYDSNDDSITR
jgi:tetratricopeptide (TPR) repeat protein